MSFENLTCFAWIRIKTTGYDTRWPHGIEQCNTEDAQETETHCSSRVTQTLLIKPPDFWHFYCLSDTAPVSETKAPWTDVRSRENLDFRVSLAKLEAVLNQLWAI